MIFFKLLFGIITFKNKVCTFNIRSLMFYMQLETQNRGFFLFDCVKQLLYVTGACWGPGAVLWGLLVRSHPLFQGCVYILPFQVPKSWGLFQVPKIQALYQEPKTWVVLRCLKSRGLIRCLKPRLLVLVFDSPGGNRTG